jgi:RNA polymerase sigma-70 factor, ECF subfamily
MQNVEASVETRELAIREHCERGAFDAALTATLQLYADELFGFLRGLARDQIQAEEAFSATCERLWRGLSGFRWDSTLRVWAYRIARNEFLRTVRDTARVRKQVPLSEVASIRAAVERVRSATPLYMQTEVKDRFAALRAQLAPEDHMLLGLRIDRKLPWIDIAKVLAASDDAPSPREIAALRKRFERLKQRLRELAAGD